MFEVEDGVWDVAPEFAISQAQADFLDDDRNRHPAFVSGLGGGKTFSGLLKGLDLSLVNMGCPAIFMEPTHGMVKRIMLPTLFDEILNPREIPYDYNKSDHVLKLPWGSEIWFDTAENPKLKVGTQIAVGYIDEVGLVSELVWKNLNSRARLTRAVIHQLYATMTPDNPGWTHDRWGSMELYGEPLPKGYEVYQGESADNWTLEGYEDTLLAEYDEVEAQSKVYGRFKGSMKGRVYYPFEPRGNVHKDAVYDPKLPLEICFDFNLSPGMHVELCQIRKDKKKIFVVDEIYASGMVLETACREVLIKYAGKQKSPVRVYGDANGHHIATKRSYYHIIHDIFKKGLLGTNGFKVGVRIKAPYKNPPVSDSIMAVRGVLCSAKGYRTLIINPQCRRLISDLHNVRTSASMAEELGKGFRGNEDDIHKGDPKLTHASDGIRYFINIVRPVRGKFQRQTDYQSGQYRGMTHAVQV